MTVGSVTVDLSALISNAQKLQEKVGKFYCVLKCDAYGHGAERCADALYGAGFDKFAVYSLEQATQIKEYTRNSDILILGRTSAEYATEVIENGFIQTVGSEEYASELAPCSKGMRVHIKIDTGMNRDGFKCSPERTVNAFSGFAGAIEGVYTHFNRAQDSSLFHTESQLADFKRRAAFLETSFGHTLQKHAAASAAAVRLGDVGLDMSRIGIALYGGFDKIYSTLGLKSVMSFCGKVCSVKKVNVGENVGYGSEFVAKENMIIATVSLGYSNGISRCISSFAPLIKDEYTPIIGRVCMDRCMLDITPLFEKGVCVKPYDTVEFFGTNAPVSRFSKAEGTIPYETLLRVGNLNKRIYKQTP